MANTIKKYVSLDKLGVYDDKIKKYLADADTTALNAAKAYSDSLAENYEPSGTVATAQAALQKNIDAAQSAADAAAAAAAAAQSEVDALETLVGALPEGTEATSVVDYVNKKTAGIATDAALSELNGQVSGLQTAVQGIQADYLKAADKTELSDAISAEASRADAAEKANAAAIKAIADDYLKAADKETLQGNIDGVAEDVAEIAGDYLKAADKTELQGKIDAKAAQTALDAEVERAKGIEGGLRTDVDAIKADYLKSTDKTELQGNIDTLTGVVETLRDGIDTEKVDGVKDLIAYVEEHGTEVTGMKEDISKNAEAIDGVAGRVTTAEGKITTVEGAVATKVEQSVYDAKVKALEDADTALSGRLDTLAAINHEAYVAADTALKNELTAEIGKKADASTVSDMDAAYKAADTALSGRLDAVEALMGDGDGSVADQIADVKAELQGEMATAIEGAKTDASNKDAVVLAEAQKATAAVQTAIDAHTANADIHVTSADKTKWNAALQASDIAVGGANGTISVKGSDVAVKGLGSAAYAATTAFDASGSAAQALTDAKAYTDEAFGKFEECSESDINGLFA